MPMPNTPYDIIINILEKLPVKSLIRFKLVCKLWQRIIESSQFVRMHLNYSRTRCEKILLPMCKSRPFDFFNYEFHSTDACVHQRGMITHETEILLPLWERLHESSSLDICSCDGMVLLGFANETIILWNPSTRKFKDIPIPYLTSREMKEAEAAEYDAVKSAVYGFGYDSSCEDYKIVRIRCNYIGSLCDALVFTLNTSSWRTIEFANCYRRAEINTTVFTKGAIHFIALKMTTESKDHTILSLDLATEQFVEIEIPHESVPKRYRHSMYLNLLGDRLCLQLYYLSGLDVWSMEEYGNSNSWTKIISLPSYQEWNSILNSLSTLEPACLVQNGDILVGCRNTSTTIRVAQMHDVLVEKKSEFYICDQTNNTCRNLITNISNQESLEGIRSLVTYKESLILP